MQCKSLTPYLLRKISPFCCICLAKQRWSLWGICLLCRMFRFKPLFIYPLHPAAWRTLWAKSTSNPRFVEAGAGSLFHYHSLFLEQVEKFRCTWTLYSFLTLAFVSLLNLTENSVNDISAFNPLPHTWYNRHDECYSTTHHTRWHLPNLQPITLLYVLSKLFKLLSVASQRIFLF